MTGVSARVFDPQRLAAVRATGLLDTAAEEPFDRLAGLAATLLDAPLAFITLVDETRSFWKSCIGADGDVRQNTVEESFCRYVIGSREPLIVGDAKADPRTRENPSIETMGVAAWAGFPLFAPDGEILGTFCVVDTRPRQWSERDVVVLRTLSLAAAGEIALRAALRAASDQAERSAALAETLQHSLLPPVLPTVPHVDVAALYSPAGSGVDVVGDFYDVFEAADAWHAVIGDVSGKGVMAARVTGLARWTVRAAAMRSVAPSVVLEQLNEALLAQPAGQRAHLTAALATLSPGPGRLCVELCTAGHMPGLIRRGSGAVERLGRSGTLLGAVEDVSLQDTRATLGPGDLLILYTDGVTEARGARGLLGEERLEELVARAPGGSAKALAEAVLAAVLEWTDGPLRDDVAVLVLGPTA